MHDDTGIYGVRFHGSFSPGASLSLSADLYNKLVLSMHAEMNIST